MTMIINTHFIWDTLYFIFILQFFSSEYFILDISLWILNKQKSDKKEPKTYQLFLECGHRYLRNSLYACILSPEGLNQQVTKLNQLKSAPFMPFTNGKESCACHTISREVLQENINLNLNINLNQTPNKQVNNPSLPKTARISTPHL